MAAIVCPTDCTQALPTVSFSSCNPEINSSEIVKIFVSKGNSKPFDTWKEAAEWTERLGTPAQADDKILELTVSGEKPAPEKQVRAISNFRQSVTTKSHSVPFEIDETNATNHEFVRALECGGTFRVWYKTASGHIFGGNEGLGKGIANIFIDMTLAKGEDGIMLYPGTVEWKAKHTEEREISPI